jgi:hypothetical protein
MLLEHSGIDVAQVLQQSCGPFDVREEEGHGAARQVGHGLSALVVFSSPTSDRPPVA